jgi:hypothetical protein
MLLAFVRFGTLEFQEIARSAAGIGPETAFGTVSAITLLLFIGATGKSAQIPLYVWLPDAMEGPTPVSALIHAATMVTAGVYMIGRNAVLFSHAPQTLMIVAVIGTATALMAATIGLVQNDIKRVLAYSDRLQLGYNLAWASARVRGNLSPLHPRVLQGALFPGVSAVIHAGRPKITADGRIERSAYYLLEFLVGALAISGFRALRIFSGPGSSSTRSRAAPAVLGRRDVDVAAGGDLHIRIMFLAFPPQGCRAVRSALRASHGTRRLHDAPPAMALALIVWRRRGGGRVRRRAGRPRRIGLVREVPRAELCGTIAHEISKSAVEGLMLVSTLSRRASRSRFFFRGSPAPRTPWSSALPASTAC